MTERLRVEILSELNDAWLNINYNKNELYKPFDLLTTDDPEEFYKTFTWLMIQPEYFCFLCKNILNIDLVPFQGLMLEEIWKRKFPMLIGSRGVGKTFLLSLYSLMRALIMPERKVVVIGAAFRQSKFLHEYMETIWKKSPILRDLCDSNSGPRRDVDMCRMIINSSMVTAIPVGDGCVSPFTLTTYNNSIGNITEGDSYSNVWGNGKFRNIEYSIDNGVKPTKIITTKRGYSYEGTYNHAMKVLRNGSIDWVRTDDMRKGDRILIDRSKRWHNGDINCSLDQAYALGAMIGDGCWTDPYGLSFATKDKEIIDRIDNLVPQIVDGPNQNKNLYKPWKMSKDEVHWKINSKSLRNKFLKYWGLDKCYAIDKCLPRTILEGSKQHMSECLAGLYDTDGHVYIDTSRGGNTISVNFTNTSKRLVEQIQYILLHYGIVSTLTYRDRDKKWNRIYELGIYGRNVKLFADQINFRLPRKREKLSKAISQKKRWNSLDDSIPVTHDQVLSSLQGSPYKEEFSKSKVLSRQSFQINFLQRVLEHIDHTPDWAELVNPDIFYDEVSSIEDSQCHTYDIHIPDGNEYCANGFFSHNSKIRGLRANDIIADEFASQSRDIFENVIAGFGAVSSSPSEGVKLAAAKNLAKQRGYDLSLLQENFANEDFGNQIVLSGTAYYDFNHFATYWKRWRSIINSKGDPVKLKETFGEEKVPDSFNWKDYSVIRMPFELIPKGFMDDAQVARSKATVHNGIYLMEFSAVFCTDSAGFFKRSLIEACTGSEQKPIKLPSGDLYFDPSLKGQVDKQYIIGVDPASEVDNFSIVVLEVNPDHRRVAHVWTTTRKEYNERLKRGLTQEGDFYAYCARRIRDLMGAFPTTHIAMDAQGGGIAVAEALHDPVRLLPGELPIWPVIDEDKEKDTDDEQGLHILELCQFAKYDWLSEANHGLRKDLEDKVLLFPRFDPITIGLSIEQDKASNRTYDTLEDCVMEIEALKDELCLIEIRQTPTGRDQWNTPEIKTGVGKKDRLRKDRYSALLMANMAARQTRNARIQDSYEIYGGFASVPDSKKKTEAVFLGPNWYTEKMNGVY